MLIDVLIGNNPIGEVIAKINGGSPEPRRLAEGVYEVDHFGFEHNIAGWRRYNESAQRMEVLIAAGFETDNNPDFVPGVAKVDGYQDDFLGFSSYGVCDNWKQILEACPEIATVPGKYVISVTPMERAKQEPHGGWRWHKGGPYIGTQKPTCEYLFDEPDIEVVYCYHVIALREEEADGQEA